MPPSISVRFPGPVFTWSREPVASRSAERAAAPGFDHPIACVVYGFLPLLRLCFSDPVVIVQYPQQAPVARLHRRFLVLFYN